MKILISTDMEGISGVADPRFVEPIFPEYYAQGQDLLAHDISATVRGLRCAGVQEIDVLDLHASGGNILVEKLDSGVNYLGGFRKWIEMMRSGELRNYDGWIQIGMHSATGTLDGHISHTNGTNIALRQQDEPMGEIAEFAWSAGYFGIPTLYVAGDDAAAREAKAHLPGVKTVVVKNALSRADADCLPLEEAALLLENAAAESIKNLDAAKVYTIPEPIDIKVIFADPEMTFSASLIPNSTQVDDVTVAYSAENYLEALDFIFTAVGSANSKWAGPMLGRLSKLEGAEEAIFDHWVEWGKNWLNQPPPFPVVKYE